MNEHKPRTVLDRAILASLLAMAAMNIFVLAQQLQSSENLAALQTKAERA